METVDFMINVRHYNDLYGNVYANPNIIIDFDGYDNCRIFKDGYLWYYQTDYYYTFDEIIDKLPEILQNTVLFNLNDFRGL